MDQSAQPVTEKAPIESRLAIPRGAFLATALVVALDVALIIAVTIPYYRLAKRVDRQLAAGAFQHALTYFAAPEIVTVGDPVTAAEFAAMKGSAAHSSAPVELQISNGAISSITD